MIKRATRLALQRTSLALSLRERPLLMLLVAIAPVIEHVVDIMDISSVTEVFRPKLHADGRQCCNLNRRFLSGALILTNNVGLSVMIFAVL